MIKRAYIFTCFIKLRLFITYYVRYFITHYIRRIHWVLKKIVSAASFCKRVFANEKRSSCRREIKLVNSSRWTRVYAWYALCFYRPVFLITRFFISRRWNTFSLRERKKNIDAAFPVQKNREIIYLSSRLRTEKKILLLYVYITMTLRYIYRKSHVKIILFSRFSK